jgi:cell filamentation protein
VTEFVDPYLDAEHGCLRNLLEITDARLLAIEEAGIVAVRLRQLDDRVDVTPTTVEHWCSVHRHLFGDVCSWAGEFRTVDITKGTHTFHPVSHLYTAAEFCSQQMLQIAHLEGPDADTLAERLAVLLSDMNETHPFREGNGRTQRFVIGRLAAQHAHPIACNQSGTEHRAVNCLAIGSPGVRATTPGRHDRRTGIRQLAHPRGRYLTVTDVPRHAWRRLGDVPHQIGRSIPKPLS